jgi:hypothetical protein
MHRFFGPSVADQFDDKIQKAVNVFLHRLSESPERFLKHAHLYVNPTQSLYYSGLTTCPLNEKSERIFDPVDCVRGEHRV